MRTIDVSDLPERFQRALAEQVERIRARLTRSNSAAKDEVPDLKTSNLGVKGALTREEIYEDRV